MSPSTRSWRDRVWGIRIWYGLLSLWALSMARGAVVLALGQVVPAERFGHAAILPPLALAAAVPLCLYAVRHGDLATGLTGPVEAFYSACGLGVVLAVEAVYAALRPAGQPLAATVCRARRRLDRSHRDYLAPRPDQLGAGVGSRTHLLGTGVRGRLRSGGNTRPTCGAARVAMAARRRSRIFARIGVVRRSALPASGGTRRAETGVAGAGDRLRPVGGVEFAQHRRDVVADGLLRYHQAVGDLGVALSSGHQHQHLTLPGADRTGLRQVAHAPRQTRLHRIAAYGSRGGPRRGRTGSRPRGDPARERMVSVPVFN
jgi:hypothetical protein